LRGATVVSALALLIAGCSSASPPDAAPRPSTSAPATSTATATASTPSPGEGLDRYYSQRPDWEDCDDGFECARLDVPLDYADPGGETLTIAVNRRPARVPSRRIGALLVNPGGPGASGLDYARGTPISDALRERFDLVGFDPRGVGESTPVTCLDDGETDDFLAADGSPDTAAEERRVVELATLFGQRCAERSGELLAHVSTVEAARDLDVVRAVLGEDRLRYLGKSYGTYLGATYAELFPDRVGRLVLDGVVDPLLTSADLNRGQALGFERALRAFVDDCVQRSGCPLPGGRERALAAVETLLDDIDRQPLPTGTGRPLTQGLAVLGLALGLYDEEFWVALRQGLEEAQDGDGATLLVLADVYADRARDGNYANNAIAAQYAVNCLDRAESGDLAAVRATAARLDGAAPHFGAYLGWSSLPCGLWPVEAVSTPHPVRAVGAAPILVVGTTRDPATPYAWARSLASQLESGRLLTHVGDGHTAYRQGNRCVDRAVDRYLLSGRLPVEGARCG